MNNLKGFALGLVTSATFGLIPLFTLPLILLILLAVTMIILLKNIQKAFPLSIN